MDPQKVIQTLLASEYYASARKREEPGYQPLVTISRDFGAGGSEIAERLALRLGVPRYDRELLDAVAKRAKLDPQAMEHLDERARDSRDSWLSGLLWGKNTFMPYYRHHLFDVLLRLAPQGGVIVGRGAHIVLANREAFRLRVVGSEERCAIRVAAREGIDEQSARKRVRQVNQQRGEFLFKLVGRRPSEAHSFDLVLNTDKLDDWDAASAFVLTAMQAMGFRLPEMQNPRG